MVLRRRIAFPIISLCTTAFLAACGSIPLDLTPEEWGDLSPAQQTLALEKQAEIDALGDHLVARSRQDAALTALSESTRDVRVEQRRERARLGDILQCAINDAAGAFSSSQAVFTSSHDKGFSIVRGESLPVEIRSRDGQDVLTVYADYADSGMLLRLCSLPPAGPGVPAPADQCDTIAAPFQALRDGITRPLNVPHRLTGTLRCAFSPGAPVQILETGETLEQTPLQ